MGRGGPGVGLESRELFLALCLNIVLNAIGRNK